MNRKNKLPKFFNNNDADYGYEAFQDFYLSWTIRCAQLYNKNINVQVYEYARKMLYALIAGKNNENLDFVPPTSISKDFELLEVEIKRQFKGTDIIADITVFLNGHKTRYVLNIENKWYKDISQHQLPKYKNAIESYYQGENVDLIHIAIFCDYEKIQGTVQENINKKLCKEHGYTLLTICDLQDFMGIVPKNENSETGNALFDEYWVYL